eukprot:9503906-Pyramimonas_sp.AAC.2
MASALSNFLRSVIISPKVPWGAAFAGQELRERMHVIFPRVAILAARVGLRPGSKAERLAVLAPIALHVQQDARVREVGCIMLIVVVWPRLSIVHGTWALAAKHRHQLPLDGLLRWEMCTPCLAPTEAFVARPNSCQQVAFPAELVDEPVAADAVGSSCGLLPVGDPVDVQRQRYWKIGAALLCKANLRVFLIRWCIYNAWRQLLGVGISASHWI